MKLKYLIICLFSLCALSMSAEKSWEVLDKAVAKLAKSPGVNSNFKIVSDNGNITGSFKSSGKKFKLETSVGTTWFDGKNMWTSNPRSKQITLVNPTTSEINEVNPFAYMNGYKGKFKTGFSRREDPQNFLIVLNPLNSKENIKAVEIAVNKKNYLPQRFIIRDNNDKITTIYINSLNIKASNQASIFICPVNSMNDFELVDLR